MNLRPARPDDVAAIARLHADRISEGFLTSLGSGFLRRLYRRVLATEGASTWVAAEGTDVWGFAAGVRDLSGLYRQFLLRDGVAAGVAAAPRLIRAFPRVLETLRYPATTEDLPSAEVLAVAVGSGHGGRGLGRDLVGAVTDDLGAGGAEAIKVVTTADNDAALAMYRAAGFRTVASVEIHDGRTSEVLVWTAPSH